MQMLRILLALLIGLAVASAPVASALAATSKAAVHDCHGKSAEDHSCCEKMGKCPDACGVKCCKLMGMVTVLPVIEPASLIVPEAVEPQKPPDWRLRPRPPPPRS
jgi:hypothetical protein